MEMFAKNVAQFLKINISSYLMFSLIWYNCPYSSSIVNIIFKAHKKHFPYLKLIYQCWHFLVFPTNTFIILPYVRRINAWCAAYNKNLNPSSKSIENSDFLWKPLTLTFHKSHPYLSLPTRSTAAVTTEVSHVVVAGMQQSHTHTLFESTEAINEYRYYMWARHRTNSMRRGVVWAPHLRSIPHRFAALLDTCVFYDQREELLTRPNMVLDSRP